MKVSSKTIDYLTGIITWDSKKTPYLSKSQLVSFFTNFLFASRLDAPSRKKYCKQNLLSLNNQNIIEEVIEFYYQPINFIENQKEYKLLVKELNNYLYFDDLELVIEGKKAKLYSKTEKINTISEASFSNNVISIALQKEIFNHVKELLTSGNYFHAIEEAYKIVREKLKSITWEEQAHKWFKEENLEIIFWHKPKDDAEKDFFEWVKFLHMAIQKLRNEKAHTLAKPLDKNLAIHYIVLASLAYDLINKNNN